MSIRTVLRYFKGEWPTLVGGSVMAAFGAVFDALSVVLIVGLADAVSREAPRLDQAVGPLDLSMSLGATAAAAATSIVVSVVALLALSQLRSRAVTRWATVRRLALVDAFIKSDWDTQSRDRAGTLQSELAYVGYASSLLGALVNVSRGVIGLAILVGTAFVFNMAAALLIMLLGITISVLLRPINRSVKARSAEQALQTRRVNEELGELSRLARDIRVFGVQGEFRQKLSAPIEALGDAERRLGVLAGVVTPIYQAMALSLIVAGLYASSRFTSVDAGLLGIIALLMLRSISYGQQLQGALTAISQALPALEIIDQSLDRLEASEPSPGTLPLDRVSTVEIDQIHFSYGDSGPVLMGISDRFSQGEIIGLIGRSGSGKTTLAQILLRLRTPLHGRVLVNGEPAEAYDSSAWTREVSFVPQETYLLHGSIHDNIAMLRPWIGRAEVERAAIAAGIHDTICSLPMGYDSVVGSGARDLSGGQRQRIGIARALVDRPSVLVLDEPTSALDHRSEATVQEALSALKGHTLVIVIAHRLSTLAICDRVICLADGRIEREMPPEMIERVAGDTAILDDESVPAFVSPDADDR